MIPLSTEPWWGQEMKAILAIHVFLPRTMVVTTGKSWDNLTRTEYTEALGPMAVDIGHSALLHGGHFKRVFFFEENSVFQTSRA